MLTIWTGAAYSEMRERERENEMGKNAINFELFLEKWSS